MASFQFNAHEYSKTKDESLGYTNWELGRTPCLILTAVDGVGSTSGLPHYCIQIEAIAGANQGKRHRIYYVLEHQNPKVVQYAKRDLSALVLACGMQGFDHVSEMSGKKFVVDIGAYLSKKTGVLTQSFNKFERFPEAPAAVAADFNPNASTYGAIKPGAFRAKQPNVDLSAPIQDDDIPF